MNWERSQWFIHASPSLKSRDDGNMFKICEKQGKSAMRVHRKLPKLGGGVSSLWTSCSIYSIRPIQRLASGWDFFSSSSVRPGLTVGGFFHILPNPKIISYIIHEVRKVSFLTLSCYPRQNSVLFSVYWFANSRLTNNFTNIFITDHHGWMVSIPAPFSEGSDFRSRFVSLSSVPPWFFLKLDFDRFQISATVWSELLRASLNKAGIYVYVCK